MFNWVNREVRAFGASILFLVLGILAVWVSSELLDITGDTPLVAVLLIPAVVYLIMSGRLTALRGPGGLEANFIRVATRQVERGTEFVATEDIQQFEKGSVVGLEGRLADLDASKPIALTLVHGAGGSYDRNALMAYMQTLERVTGFKLVVINDSAGRFMGSLAPKEFWRLLEDEDSGYEFVEELNNGRIENWPRWRALGVTTVSLSGRSTNAEALREMTALNLTVIGVVDERGKLTGVVERDQILSQMVLAINDSQVDTD